MLFFQPTVPSLSSGGSIVDGATGGFAQNCPATLRPSDLLKYWFERDWGFVTFHPNGGLYKAEG